MAVGKDKTRILLTLPQDLKEELTSEAKGDNRSLNNYIFLTLELNIKKTVGNTRFAPCFQRFFCTLILDSSLNSILLHSETESKSCSV